MVVYSIPLSSSCSVAVVLLHLVGGCGGCAAPLSALNRHVHTITFPNLQTLGFLFGYHAMGHKVGTEGGWGRERRSSECERGEEKLSGCF